METTHSMESRTIFFPKAEQNRIDQIDMIEKKIEFCVFVSIKK